MFRLLSGLPINKNIVCVNALKRHERRVSDNPQLDAQVPAAVPRGVRVPEDGGLHEHPEPQDVHLPRDQVHGRHRLPEPPGTPTRWCSVVAMDRPS